RGSSPSCAGGRMSHSRARRGRTPRSTVEFARTGPPIPRDDHGNAALAKSVARIRVVESLDIDNVTCPPHGASACRRFDRLLQSRRISSLSGRLSMKFAALLVLV